MENSCSTSLTSEVTAAGNKWKREQTPSPYKRMKKMKRSHMIIKCIRGTNPPWDHLSTTPGFVVHVDLYSYALCMWANQWRYENATWGGHLDMWHGQQKYIHFWSFCPYFCRTVKFRQNDEGETLLSEWKLKCNAMLEYKGIIKTGL